MYQYKLSKAQEPLGQKYRSLLPLQGKVKIVNLGPSLLAAENHTKNKQRWLI